MVLQNIPEKDMSQYGRYRYHKKIRSNGFGKFQIVPYTRKRAIKYYCLECMGFIHAEVEVCTMPECPLFPYRLGKLPKNKTAEDRKKDIRRHCLECCSGDSEYIFNCPSLMCPVHPFRLPKHKTDLTNLIPAGQINFPCESEKGNVLLEENFAV